MQTAGNDGALSPLLMERVQPSAALEFADDASLDGYLGAAVSHVGVETLQIRLKGKEATRPDADDAGALEEKGQLPYEPAVDRCRIRGRCDDATGESTIWMCEGCHIRIEVENPETSSRSQNSNQLRDGSFSPWYMGEHSH